MKRYEIIDAIEEIRYINNKRFVGVNEAELWTREDIADFVLKLLAEKDAEIERLKELIVSAKPPQITQQLAANPYQCTPNICAKRTTGGCDLGKCIMDLTNEA